MVSICSFQSSLIQHDIHLAFDGPIKSKIDDRSGYALGHGYPVFYSQIKSAPSSRQISGLCKNPKRGSTQTCQLHTETTELANKFQPWSMLVWCDNANQSTTMLFPKGNHTQTWSLKHQTVVFRYLVLSQFSLVTVTSVQRCLWRETVIHKGFNYSSEVIVTGDNTGTLTPTLTGSKSTHNFPSLLSFWLVWGSFTCLIDCQKHQRPLCLSSKDKESQSVFVHGCLASDDQRRSCASISRLLHWAATAKRVLAEDRTISFKVCIFVFTPLLVTGHLQHTKQLWVVKINKLLKTVLEWLKRHFNQKNLHWLIFETTN